MNTVSVNDSFTVDGNNVITTVQDPTAPVPATAVQFSFQTAPNIRWWKAIKIINASNQMVGLLANEEQDHGPELSQQLAFDQFGEQIKVEIWKAKALGIHTHVATVFFKTSDCSGKLTILTWEND